MSGKCQPKFVPIHVTVCLFIATAFSFCSSINIVIHPGGKVINIWKVGLPDLRTVDSICSV